MDPKTKELKKQLKRMDRVSFYMRRWFVLVSVSIVLVGMGTGLGFWSKNISDQNTILPRVMIGGVKVGSLTQKEAEKKLTEQVKKYLAQPFVFLGKSQQKDAKAQTFKAKPEELGLEISIQDSVREAFNLGHGTNSLSNLIAQVLIAIGGKDLPVVAEFDSNTLTAFFDVGFLKIEEPAQDARLAYKDGDFINVEPQSGSEVYREPVYLELNKLALSLKHETINLELRTTEPTVQVKDLTQTKQLAQKILESGLNLYYDDKNFPPVRETIGSWLEFHTLDPKSVYGGNSCDCGLPNNPNAELDINVPSLLVTSFEQERRGEEAGEPYYVLIPPENFSGKKISAPIPIVGINRNKLNDWLSENVAADVDVPGQNVRLAFEDGKVKVTKPSVNGIEVDLQQALREITFKIATKDPNVRLTLVEAQPEISEDNINELGIKTLIGKGVSDFSGSPANRIHNIKRGFEQYDGLVIAPGEEFSAIKYLGPVDAASGFLPELVIVEKRITPQYGGGLCQVSTTLFRAALDSGFEVTDRINHAFSVSYYMWPYADWGVEASIYDPVPDLKFVNDTDSYVLLHAYTTEDYKAVVEVYGTDPERTTTIEGPYRLSGSYSAGGTTTFNYIVADDSTGKEVRRQEFVSIFQPIANFKHD